MPATIELGNRWGDGAGVSYTVLQYFAANDCCIQEYCQPLHWVRTGLCKRNQTPVEGLLLRLRFPGENFPSEAVWIIWIGLTCMASV